jgi:hypothetical protein
LLRGNETMYVVLSMVLHANDYCTIKSWIKRDGGIAECLPSMCKAQGSVSSVGVGQKAGPWHLQTSPHLLVFKQASLLIPPKRQCQPIPLSVPSTQPCTQSQDMLREPGWVHTCSKGILLQRRWVFQVSPGNQEATVVWFSNRLL